MTTRAIKQSLFYGCWKEAGHFLFSITGGRVRDPLVENLSPELHIDGSLAPKVFRGAVTCLFLITDNVARRRAEHGAEECPEGQFLRHVLPSGFTAIAFWDRNQGDTRPGCNSNFLLFGEHTSEVMLTEFRKHFPHVVENLDNAGVALVEVFPTRAISTP